LAVLSITIVLVILIYILWFNEPDYSADKFTAIIVEPRKHKALDFVLGNFLENYGVSRYGE
jgi:hypothetical protein